MTSVLVLTEAHARLLIAFDERDTSIGVHLADGWMQPQRRSFDGIRLHDLVHRRLLEVEQGRSIGAGDGLHFKVFYRLSEKGRQALTCGVI